MRIASIVFFAPLGTTLSLRPHAVAAITTASGPDNLTIGVEGSCPSQLTFRWDGASPDHAGALAFSHATGNYVLPGPPCDGTRLGLGCSGIRLLKTFRTGPEGSGRMVGRAAAFACGGYVQMIVIETSRPCQTSSVVQIPH